MGRAHKGTMYLTVKTHELDAAAKFGENSV
jgi:hypothetical protein